MFVIKYGNDVLHDPRAGIVVSDAILDVELNTSSDLKFTINHGHNMYKKLRERDTSNPVTVWEDDELLFWGDIVNIESGFKLRQNVECRGDLAWLNDTIVRPYSTVAEECSNVAPKSASEYFEWLIEGHNGQVESRKKFTVDINEVNDLASGYIDRSDSTCPSTGSVIKEKLIDRLGGYLRIRHVDDINYIDYLRDMPDDNAQLIDFGENLLDYTSTDSSEDLATYVMPLGSNLDKPENAPANWVQRKVDISSITDGEPQEGFVKSGDIIYSKDAVSKYGWIGAVAEFDDVTKASNLIDNGITALKELMSPVRTIEVKAIDMSAIKPDLNPIIVGQYVRVRSKPHDFDSYMLCMKIRYDINNPENTLFTLGHTFDVLTGIQDSRIKALNGTINQKYQEVAAISEEAKAAAGSAIVGSVEWFAIGDSYTVPPDDGWTDKAPEWEPGKLIWRKIVTTYGDGTVVEGDPVIVTGNNGVDATVLRIDSSMGTVFKDNDVSTVLTAVIFHGPERIIDIDDLKRVYGSSARLEWSWHRLDDDSSGVISSSDPRIGDGGFTLTVSASDVTNVASYSCQLEA